MPEQEREREKKKRMKRRLEHYYGTTKTLAGFLCVCVSPGEVGVVDGSPSPKMRHNIWSSSSDEKRKKKKKFLQSTTFSFRCTHSPLALAVMMVPKATTERRTRRKKKN